MNWRRRKKLWKKAFMWRTSSRNRMHTNGSNKSLRTMWLITGMRPTKDWAEVERRTLRYWA